MNLKELVANFREDIRDLRQPYLVSPRQAVRLANAALVDAVRRGRLIVDSTSDLSEIQVTAKEPVIELDPRILQLRRARAAGSGVTRMAGSPHAHMSIW